MALNRKKSALSGVPTAKQTLAAEHELHARWRALLTWKAVSFGLGAWCNESYIRQVAMGKRPPSRRLLRALGIIKPEKRSGIRIRMSVAAADQIIFALMGPDAPPVRMRLVRLAAKAGSQYAIDYMKSRGIK